MKPALRTFDGNCISDERVVMRDSVTLVARIYRPSDYGRFPVRYCGSPHHYDTDNLPDSALFPWSEVGPLEWYLKEQGYAFVHLDVRGSDHSEGDWDPWSVLEREDHREVQDSIAGADWSTGKIGSYGQSYYCMTQWLKASHRAVDESMGQKLGRTIDSHDNPEVLELGNVYKLETCLAACAHLFKKGNRIRLEVSNADSGLTDAHFATFYYWGKVGTDTYHHSKEHPSHVQLPVNMEQ